MSPKEKAPRTGESLSNPVKPRHRILKAGAWCTAAAFAAGGALIADGIHAGYSVLPHAEKSADGGTGVVTKIVPLEAQCMLASTTVVEGANSKYDFKMTGTKGIPLIGGGLANISVGNRTMTIDSITINDSFCTDAGSMRIEYDAKTATYTVKIPGDQVYAQSSPDFSAEDSDTTKKFKFTPGGSITNGLVAGVQSFVNSSPLHKMIGFSGIASGLNETDSALLGGGLLSAQLTADRACGSEVLKAASQTYLDDAVAIAKMYAEPVREGVGSHGITYKAEFVEDDMRTPYNLAHLAVKSTASEGLATFLKGDGASVSDGKMTDGKCSLSPKVAAQVKSHSGATPTPTPSGVKG